MIETARLLASVEPLEGRGELPPYIEALAYDSRKVAPGTLFVALRGTRTDGHRYLDAASRAGAVGAVVEEIPAEAPLPCIRLADTLAGIPRLAAELFGHPARELLLAGITGTNGKTSTTYLLESIWAAAGTESAVIGTISHRWKDRVIRAANTTPLALDLQEILASIRDDGVRHVAMEVSSHGLCLHRVDGLRYQVAGFTNLSPEHLDFHRDLEDYGEAKARLFAEHLQPDGVGVINIDDPWGRVLFDRLPADRKLPFGLGDRARVTAREPVLTLSETRFELVAPEWSRRLRSPLIGEHNLRNLLGAAAMAVALGLPEEQIVEGLQAEIVVPGRLELIPDGRGGRILVDFAHTPDGLFEVLRGLRRVCEGRIVTVFGCGGDRDRTKRPVMGEAAQRFSDLAIVTSDNPRTEDPMRILEEVVAGMSREKSSFEVEPDRRRAIERGLELIGPGDVLLVAGKGHETRQLIGKESLEFDDRAIVRELLSQREGEPLG